MSNSSSGWAKWFLFFLFLIYLLCLIRSLCVAVTPLVAWSPNLSMHRMRSSFKLVTTTEVSTKGAIKYNFLFQRNGTSYGQSRTWNSNALVGFVRKHQFLQENIYSGYFWYLLKIEIVSNDLENQLTYFYTYIDIYVCI